MNDDQAYDITLSKDDILEEAMSQYGKEVLFIAYSYVKDYSVAEDIAQEVFVRFYQRFESFRNESSLKTWIIRIAINQSKDHLKKWETRKLTFTNKLHDIIHQGKNDGPESEIIHKETGRELLKNLLSLPIKYREILFLYYYEELKISEISDCLDININTAKTRLKTGKEKLQKMTDEGLQGFDFNNSMKDTVRNRVAVEKPKREYRRRWYAPLISFLIILLFVFVFAVVRGEQWGFLGSEKLSGYFTNKSNFDVEIRYSPGPIISTFTDSIKNGEEEKSLSFTKAEMNEIYTKVDSMNLKEDERISDNERCHILLNRTYTMTIRMNKDLYKYNYSACGTNADKREFEELRELIMTILKQKPAYEDILKQEIMM